MTVQELMEMLEDMPQDAEVRLAMQPNWPFEYSIGRVIEPAEMAEFAEDAAKDGGNDFDSDDEIPEAVYIGEGTQLGYLPGLVSQTLGWR